MVLSRSKTWSSPSSSSSMANPRKKSKTILIAIGVVTLFFIYHLGFFSFGSLATREGVTSSDSSSISGMVHDKALKASSVWDKDVKASNLQELVGDKAIEHAEGWTAEDTDVPMKHDENGDHVLDEKKLDEQHADAKVKQQGKELWWESAGGDAEEVKEKLDTQRENANVMPTSIKLPATYAATGSVKAVTSHPVAALKSTGVVRPPASSSSPPTDIQLSEILLLVKTGASTLWRRLPSHLLTYLSTSPLPPENIIIYSDLHESIGPSFTAIDILSSPSILSSIEKHDPKAYAAYTKQQDPSRINTYREHALLPGDEPPYAAGQTPGWILDRYKFLPMLQHAASFSQNLTMDIKWYIYIEDDTYPFLFNIMSYLSTLPPHTIPQYHGARSGPNNASFAQGGSGIAFSSSSLSSIFTGPETPTLDNWGEETANSCCGDITLGSILRSYEIEVNDGGWGTVGWRPEPAWKTGFDSNLWCERVLTFHHLHQRDMVALYALERKMRGVRFKDVFGELVEPYLRHERLENWDNFASQYTLGGDEEMVPEGSSSYTRSSATKSADGCRDACLELTECMGWRHDLAQRTCGLDMAVKLGREVDPQASWEEATTITSGWVLERVKSVLVDRECANVY